MNRLPACLVCPIEMGNKESYWSGLSDRINPAKSYGGSEPGWVSDVATLAQS